MSLMAMAKKTGPGRIGRNLAIGAALLAAVSFSLAPATAYAQRGGAPSAADPAARSRCEPDRGHAKPISRIR